MTFRWLLLGMLTGAIFSLALFLTPVPNIQGPSSPMVLVPGTYRMAGNVVRNTCGTGFAPWPDEWEITAEALVIGHRQFVARPMRSSIVYEVQREEPEACVAAGWTVKLAPQGAGIVGDATLEIRPATSPAPSCRPLVAPCLVVATLEGLPLP